MAQELEYFVREALARGVPREQIDTQLRAAGWREAEIRAALEAWVDAGLPLPVPRRRASLSAREAFLYLVLFATLYTVAFNTGHALFVMVDRWAPDPARGPFTTWSLNGLRDALAALVISFPAFLLMSRWIGARLRREPAGRNSPVRRWLTYLTLFVAALVIIGDLTFLVRAFLGGQLAAPLLLKTLVVLAIAVTVFGHYWASLRQDEAARAEIRPGTAPLARAAAVAVAAVIVAGFVAVGSPAQQRLVAIDQQRVGHLQGLDGAVSSFFRARGRLPESLDEVAQSGLVGGALVLLDPVTSEPYAYARVDSVRYELCATFDAEAVPGEQLDVKRGAVADPWSHPKGRHCFRREATPAADRGVPARP